MSVVVAIKENGRVYMGADSQVTQGGTRSTLKNKNNYKIWRVKNAPNCLMAGVGRLRDACVIRTMDDLITDYELFRDEISYDFVVEKIFPRILKRLESYGYVKKEDSVELDSDFLFAYKDQLYLICFDGSVIEIDDCVSIGSGQKEAVGSLLSTDGQTSKSRIIKAITASAASDIYVDYPIILTDTESAEFDVINESSEILKEASGGNNGK